MPQTCITDWYRKGRRVVSIDVGITNLGLVVCDVYGPSDVAVVFAERINITQFWCRATLEGRTGCKLRHEAMASDWVEHLCHRPDIARELERAEVVLVERQPPGGLRCVEQLIVNAVRDKVKMVHPRTVHAHFGIGGSLGYEGRKIRAVQIARRAVGGRTAARVRAKFFSADRVHDLADALLFALWFSASVHPPQPARRPCFEEFRCKRVDITS